VNKRFEPKPPILVIGSARSGTTVFARLLATAAGTYAAMENHILWKAGDFASLGDCDHNRRASATRWVKATLEKAAGTRRLIEKSPPNSLRPRTVHAVFPDAIVIYTVREPVQCLVSNLRNSEAGAGVSLSRWIRKYLTIVPAVHDARNLAFDVHPSGGMRLASQLRARDYLPFSVYVYRLLRATRHLKLMPFGPRLDDFASVVRSEGLASYHLRVLEEAAANIEVFRALYGDSFHMFHLNDLIQKPAATIDRLFEATGLELGAYGRSILVEQMRKRAPEAEVTLGADYPLLPGLGKTGVARLLRLRYSSF